MKYSSIVIIERLYFESISSFASDAQTLHSGRYTGPGDGGFRLYTITCSAGCDIHITHMSSGI